MAARIVGMLFHLATIHEDIRPAYDNRPAIPTCCVSDVQCDVVVCGVALETDCLAVSRVAVDIAQSMTVIEYKGYRIEVSHVGRGWRAAIFAPGSTRALADSPSNLEKSSTEEIVAEAKRIIDARLGPRSL